jgi:tetratricopeptide (TPR) repeat protein
LQRRALLYLTIITVAFAPLIEGGTTHLPVFILHMLVLAMLAAWFADGYRNGRLSMHVFPSDLAGAALLAAALLSFIIAPYKYMALVWVQIIIYYLLFMFLSREALYGATGEPRDEANPPNPPELALSEVEGSRGGNGGVRNILHSSGAVVLAVLGMGVVESIWGGWQWVYGKDRLTGSFFNPNMLAGYLDPSILLAVSLAVFGDSSVFTARRGRRALLLSFAAIAFIVVILTGSRGGALALLAGGLVVLWARFGKLAIAFVAGALLLVLVIPNPVRDRVLSHETFAYSRAGIWKSSLAMIEGHPLGVGLGNFKYAFTEYNFPVKEAVIKYGKTAATAHNEYLQAGAEMGLLGLAVFLAWVFILARTMARAVGASSKSGGIGLAAGLAGGITATLVHSLVDSNLHEPGIVFLLILLVSLLLTVSGGGRDWAMALEGGKKQRTLILFAALTALMAVFAAMPAGAYYFSSKANEALRSGDVTSALMDIDTALLIEPGNASYHSQKAAALFAQARGARDKLQGSLDELEEAARLNPGDVSYPLIMSGIEYGYAMTVAAGAERQKYLESALVHAKKAVKLGQGTAEPRLTLARIYMAMGEKEQAVSVLEGLKRTEPNCLGGRLMLAMLYFDLGKTGLSRAEYYNIIDTAGRLKGIALSPQEKEFVKIDRASLDRLGKDLGVIH